MYANRPSRPALVAVDTYDDATDGVTLGRLHRMAIFSKPADTLTQQEQQAFEACEKAIGIGLQAFKQAGKALMLIKEKRLYRAKWSSFEQYLDQRWRISTSYAGRLIDAVEIVARLEGLPEPTTESQVRPLASVPPEKQRETWEKVVATVPEEQRTAAAVAAVVAESRHARPSKRKRKKSPRDVVVKGKIGKVRWSVRVQRGDAGVTADQVLAAAVEQLRLQTRKAG